MSISDVRALPEDGIGLIEKQDGAATFGGIEDTAEVLVGFADVLADHGAEIDPVKVQAQLPGQDLGGHGFPGPTHPHEEGEPVTMTHLQRAARAEYDKLNRVLMEDETEGWLNPWPSGSL